MGSAVYSVSATAVNATVNGTVIAATAVTGYVVGSSEPEPEKKEEEEVKEVEKEDIDSLLCPIT